MPAPLKIHQRHFLKSKDKKDFVNRLRAIFAENEEAVEEMMSVKSQVEWIKLDQNQELYAVDGVLTLWLSEGRFIPLLSFLMGHSSPFKVIKVDQGAIKFVSKGADVMRPGITQIDPSIKTGDVVLIEDPTHGRILSVGEALFDAAEMQQMTSGKVIKCLHSLTDAVWEFSKSFK